MVNCFVPGCVNYSAKSNGISYHKLPRDTRRRKAWLERIRRTNMPPLENCYVCSEHFSEESFEVNLRAQITGVKCKRRLKEDAIPSEFCFHPPAKRPRLSSENRLRCRSHEEVSVFCLSFFFKNSYFNHSVESQAFVCDLPLLKYHYLPLCFERV